jgi:tetratricopeptide (TPR) repeat protein
VLARAYLDEHQCDESLDVLETATYSNWEGDIDNWLVFVGAHVERGRERLKNGDALLALEDFEAALTYPKHLHVGRPSQPREAKALYWKGYALAALSRTSQARAAWQAGAAGAPMNEEQKDYISKCEEQLETES